MRGDDRHNASRSEDEALSIRLLDGIRRLDPNLRRIFVNQRILSHTPTHHSREMLLCLRKRRKCFAVMPVDNWELDRIQQGEINVVPMQVKEIAP